jgi:hypothetical protein
VKTGKNRAKIQNRAKTGQNLQNRAFARKPGDSGLPVRDAQNLGIISRVGIFRLLPDFFLSCIRCETSRKHGFIAI